MYDWKQVKKGKNKRKIVTLERPLTLFFNRSQPHFAWVSSTIIKVADDHVYSILRQMKSSNGNLFCNA